MKEIVILNPNRVVFGEGSMQRFVDDFVASGLKRMFLIGISELANTLVPYIEKLKENGVAVFVDESIKGEPTFDDFNEVLEKAIAFNADSVVGVGGGSVLDVAKLVAAQLKNTQSLDEIKGIGNLKERQTYVACIPTTSGTGSEVSPNAIFVNNLGEKVGVISPYLVPDAAYIDPVLTVLLPKSVTAATGIDALTHCLEAYTNKFAHPFVDLYALEGVRLIAKYLKRACDDGTDIEARTQVALGSMYGGMCLGPVNTAAVHALSYPLGVEYHIPHGLSNALLLPYVMEYNIEEDASKYERIAEVLGAEKKNTSRETALEGVKIMKQLIADCGLPTSLAHAGVKEESITKLAEGAIKVQRLLKNNIREIAVEDAVAIYQSAF
ncbi:Alcohol dehydrogenase, class IV [Flavobacterium glycines]|uniref:Alcohol dehydrogenase n=1 Tax=Flavobacterium glycines TaxID=551990 RepID=A0A1B9DPX8_9FLAO|nr:iron-containing alcohol dehydrogenase [Flavobacterium glycines]OCB71723.1 alcohol dehydrogenase [Flavobacterium glycines]GEL10775.1 alcohol dehydrogenase [Flavobacterium glycines]SDI54839.1 Alcohol dehydrogenase, class IV [Flavobacterium glycines]